MFQVKQEQPHVQGAVAVWAQEGREELLHVQGKEGRPDVLILQKFMKLHPDDMCISCLSDMLWCKNLNIALGQCVNDTLLCWVLGFILSEDGGLCFWMWNIHLMQRQVPSTRSIVLWQWIVWSPLCFLIGKDLLVDGIPDQDSQWKGKKWGSYLMWPVSQNKFQHLVTPGNGKW